MRIHFCKMHGLGNDFVVLDATGRGRDFSGQRFVPDAAQVRFLADRHVGIGCDQLLLVEESTTPGVDFRYRIFNADGGEVEQCGNGARCFVRFVHEQGLCAAPVVRVETAAGVLILQRHDDGEVTVDMGQPRFVPAEIPFLAEADAPVHSLALDAATLEISVVSMGNPHAVQVVADVTSAPVAQQGPLIENHKRFPRRVNAGFMQILNRGEIRLRVFERGAGETLACGTGACAAVVAGIRRNLLDASVRVHTRGGALTIRWDGPGNSVFMTGPASTVFCGDIELPETLPQHDAFLPSP